MEDLKLILSITATGIGLLITALTFFTKFLRNAKAKKLAQNIIDISNAIIPYIKQAEQFLNYTGEEKKEYVITKVNQFALENNIPFDIEVVSSKIEELIVLTKQVNIKNKNIIEKNCCFAEKQLL